MAHSFCCYLVTLCCLISEEIILKYIYFTIYVYDQFHYDFFLAFFCLRCISLTLAPEGLVFETDGNKDMLDIFWQQRRHISLFLLAPITSCVHSKFGAYLEVWRAWVVSGRNRAVEWVWGLKGCFDTSCSLFTQQLGVWTDLPIFIRCYNPFKKKGYSVLFFWIVPHISVASLFVRVDSQVFYSCVLNYHSYNSIFWVRDNDLN